MANMNYCRMENTYHDLLDVERNWDYAESDSELEYRKRILELAKEIDKPLMIHCRPAEGSMDAYQDVLKILDENYRSPNFEIHCFTGDAPTAMEFVKRGGLVALNGIITFDKTGRSDKVVKNLPLESTIFETDAPFLTPLPHRGKRNEPSYVRFVAEKLAQMKGIDISKVEEVTTANARRLFRI